MGIQAGLVIIVIMVFHTSAACITVFDNGLIEQLLQVRWVTRMIIPWQKVFIARIKQNSSIYAARFRQ